MVIIMAPVKVFPITLNHVLLKSLTEPPTKPNEIVYDSGSCETRRSRPAELTICMKKMKFIVRDNLLVSEL